MFRVAAAAELCEAASWFRRGAEAGDKAAARALASLYLTGAGVVHDQAEAARWLRIAAQGGDQAAQADLANLVLEGNGAAEDVACEDLAQVVELFSRLLRPGISWLPITWAYPTSTAWE